MRFKHGRSDRVWVVFVALVKLCQSIGVSGCDSGVGGTRQGCSCCGGGDHNVKVECLSGGEEGDVGPVELGVVFGVRCAVWVGDNDLLGQGTVPGDRGYEVNKCVA